MSGKTVGDGEIEQERMLEIKDRLSHESTVVKGTLISLGNSDGPCKVLTLVNLPASCGSWNTYTQIPISGC